MTDKTRDKPGWKHALTLSDDHGGDLATEIRQIERILREFPSDRPISLKPFGLEVTLKTLKKAQAELQRKDECIKKALNLEGKLLLIMSDWATKHQLQNALLDALKEEQ